MKFPVKLACAALVTGGMIATTEALNATPIAASKSQTDELLVQKVDWTCGPGRHVNPWGRCVPNYWRRGGYGGGWGHGYYGYPAWGGGGYGGGWRRDWYEHEHHDWDD